MLFGQLSSSTAVVLQSSDLKQWRTIIYPPARGTRQAMNARKVTLVTDRTRLLIIDFDRVTDPVHGRLRGRLFGLNINDEYPLAAVGRYHPQICHVVLYRFFESHSQLQHHSEYHLNVLGCFSESMSDLSPNVRVTLYDFALQCEEGCDMFTTTEKTLIKSWKMPWPHVTFTLSKENLNNVLRERSEKYWPYPPDQLTWLESCLNILPQCPESGMVSCELLFLNNK